MKLLLRILVLGLAHAGFAAAPVSVDTLDETIIALMAKRKVPGLSLAIIQDGAVVKAKGYGVMDRETGASVSTDTLFQAGSISKPVSAMGALLLVDRKKVSLDANVNEALRSWHLPENKFTAEKPATLRRILSHSAGLTVHGFPGYAVDAPQPTLLQVLDGEPPANTKAIRVDLLPGSQWRYSGGGYTLAQQMMIDVSGETFPEYMRAHVLEPLGMRASTYAQPLPANAAARAATGHLANGKAVPGRWHVYPEMAAAGLWTTPSDLARFALALQSCFAGEKHPVLAAETAQLMVTREKDAFGLGFGLRGQAGSEFEKFTHNGRDEGFDASFWAYRKRGQGAVVMINANDNTNVLGRVLDAIAEAYAWPNHPKVTAPKPIDDQEPAMTERVKKIFLDAQAGKFERDLYSAELAGKIAEFLPAASRNLAAMGAFKSIALVDRRDQGGRHLYRYHVACEQDELIAFCAIGADGTIEGFAFNPL